MHLFCLSVKCQTTSEESESNELFISFYILIVIIVYNVFLRVSVSQDLKLIRLHNYSMPFTATTFLFFKMIFDDRLWLVGEVSTAARWYTLRQYPRLLRHLRAARNVSFLTGICVLIIKYLVTVLLDNDHKTTISDEQRYVRNYNVGVHAVQLITIFVSSFATMKFWLFNPLETRVQRYYSATSNTMKWVRWPLMGGLLHLVQRGGDCVGPQPAEAPSRCTNCNSPLINGQCTNHRIAV